MKIIKNYNEYLFELLFEQIDNELPVKISDRLLNILIEIKHPISTYLSSLNSMNINKPITLIDYDDDNLDKFTLAQSEKIYDYIRKLLGDYKNKETLKHLFISNYKDKDFWDKNRTSYKIGKVINRLQPGRFLPNGKPGEDIESFINEIKSARTNIFSKFKIVEGNELKKYYNQNTYEYGKNSTLHNSCMRYDYCSDYFNFLIINNVKMLILMSDNNKDKIKGRALIWKLSELNHKDTNRIFMDRIYTINDYDVYKFKSYAKKEGWLYKDIQNNSTNRIVDPLDNTIKERYMKINNIEYTFPFPYMDSFKYYNTDKEYLSTTFDDDYEYELNSTDGGYIDKEDNEFSYFTNEWASLNYAEEHWNYSEKENTWINKEDSVYVDHIQTYVSRYYALDNYAYNKHDDKFYDRDYCEYSDTNYNWIPKKYAIEVFDYIDREDNGIEWRDIRDKDYIKLLNKNGKIEYYDEHFKDEFDIKYDFNKKMDYYEMKKRLKVSFFYFLDFLGFSSLRRLSILTSADIRYTFVALDIF